MVLQFFSNDKLAWIYPFDESYGVTLVRSGIPTYRVISAIELLDIINSSIFDDVKQKKVYTRTTRVREQFRITFDEAVQLKDCYANMKVYYGHDI